MQDVFVEYLVKRKNTPKIMLAKIGAVAGALGVCVFVIMFSGLLGPFSMIGTLVGFGALYGGYYLVTSMNVEFEYAVTNGEIDMDRIIAQRKRRRIVTVNCREVEGFGRYKAAEHASKNYQTKIFACDDPDSADLWYCSLRLKDKGLTLVVFNANEKMLNAIKPFLPKPIMHEAFRVGA